MIRDQAKTEELRWAVLKAFAPLEWLNQPPKPGDIERSIRTVEEELKRRGWTLTKETQP